MARRRKVQLSDYSSDDGDDDSAGSGYGSDDEPRQKRPRKSYERSKEEALYGVFADADVEENERNGGKGRTVRGADKKGRKIDYQRGTAFVPASSATAHLTDANKKRQEEKEQKGAGSDDESDSQSDSSSDEDEGDAEREIELLRNAPIDEDDALEGRPTFGGLGFGGPTSAAKAAAQEVRTGEFKPATFVSSRGGIGSRAPDAQSTDEPAQGIRAGIGSRGGIGSSSSSSNTTTSMAQQAPSSDLAASSLPAAFGFARASATAGIGSGGSTSGTSTPGAATPSASMGKRSFLHGGGMTQRGTTIKFGSGLGGGFNPAEALAKMGWSGGGLGKEGEGMVNPIDVQLRPERAGIAFGGRKEMTKQNREDAKRRGQKFSDDEEEETKQSRKGKGKDKGKAKAEGPPAWTRSEKKPRKPKLEYRTYEQILEEAEGMPSTDAGVGQIIDATGREMREVTDLASALSQAPVPSSESERLPELRHNLRLIRDGNKRDLQALAREAASLRDQQKWAKREAEEERRKLAIEEAQLKQTERVLQIVKEIEAIGKKAQVDASVTLDAFDEVVGRLQSSFAAEIVTFNLDEALVGAIAPVIRRIVANWQPLKEPKKMTRLLSKWKEVFRVEEYQRKALTLKGKAAMSPYETLVWQIIMPKIRSTLNNDWDPSHPSAAVALVEAWKLAVPRFVVDNIMDQLVLPKLKRAVSEWNRKRGTESLRHLIFAWLPVFPQRADELLLDAKRQFKSALKSWRPSADIPSDMKSWRAVFKPKEWESMMLDHIVPKLGAAIREDFAIDPGNQKMGVLESTLAWKPYLRDGVVSRIIEKEFLPKWLDVLHMWLTQPSANLDEVAQWYTFWKGWFPQDFVELPGIAQGFRRGLDLINQAVELGDNRTRLQKPSTAPMSRTEFAARQAAQAPPARPAEPEEVSFKSVVEEAASAEDLIVQTLNRTDPESGMPLLRISRGIDGKGGVTFYITDHVLWMQEKSADTGQAEFTPVSLSELFAKAK